MAREAGQELLDTLDEAIDDIAAALPALAEDLRTTRHWSVAVAGLTAEEPAAPLVADGRAAAPAFP
jgi:hypothetical protein